MWISAHAVARMLGTWRNGPGPAHQRLSDRLRLLVLDGRLPLGSALPGERDLATALAASRTTVSTAYRTLSDHGYLATSPRSRATVRLPGRRTARPAPSPDGTIDLSVAAPPAPVEVLHAAYASALEQLPRHFDRHGYDRHGTTVLREAVARGYERRGLPTSPGQVLITNGAQHALALLTRALVSPRDRIVVDHPTYPHAIRTFAEARARLVPVALTADGWDPGQLRSASRNAELAYLIPDFHNPTGQCMPSAVREGLSAGCPVIVDETMTELALDQPVPEPFARYDPSAISIGSAAKSIWGGLRIGWIRARPPILERVAQIRSGLDLGTPVLEQLAAAILLDEPDRHQSGKLEKLRAQRDILRTALAEHLPQLAVPRPPGGLALWTTFPKPISSRLAALAPEYGVTIAAGPRFGIGGAFERNLRLPYTLQPDLLTEAVQRLARAHEAVTRGETGHHEPASVA
ncbi:MocR-like transcription factor YczR [Amycolatopsis jiangsuensis]|uniref:DNA-binding transcriptional MocR family regulator n=1 Tax=Amycolatopsis jiangsuensis TaxID=1181879 RepID=A0A840IV00_9PSEU|nr:PLP-dependent aminotransferase family protein [Amycolatopsis jiangsuensis]MBB4685700.1 DNA-binding transcriptional MocR family regulator [Amycolatopsis jiangsuensis]